MEDICCGQNATLITTASDITFTYDNERFFMETGYCCSSDVDASKLWFGTYGNRAVNGDNLPIRDGYQFKEWKITSGGGSVSDSTWTSSSKGTIHDYHFDGKYAGNVTIKAQWTKLPTITVNPNGGEMNYNGGTTTSSQTITYYPKNNEKRIFMQVGFASSSRYSQYIDPGWTKINGIKEPYRKGYTFNGWQVTENGTTTTNPSKITKEENGNEGYTYYYDVSSSTGNITIKALWTQN